MESKSKRRAVIICIMALIAAIHIFRAGSYLHGELFNFYYGYFSDFILPFGGYFLICAAEQQSPFLRPWEMKLAIAFLVPSIAETCQYFGIPVLGSTFDLLDYFMYALGATLAAIFDMHVFSRLFNFWRIEKAAR
ncbi:hypothetical protein HUU05_01515 [candidate division KSB1 bacterium]|nr:hypothetical protein [candidate division KSB1 bacterium]